MPAPTTTPTPAPAPAATTPRLNDGEVRFEFQRLPHKAGLKQVFRDPMWDRVKTIGFVIAGLLVFYVYGEKMFLWGRSGSQPTPAPTVISQPASVSVTPQPQPAPVVQQTPSWPSREECERHYWLTLHEAPASRCQ